MGKFLKVDALRSHDFEQVVKGFDPKKQTTFLNVDMIDEVIDTGEWVTREVGGQKRRVFDPYTKIYVHFEGPNRSHDRTAFYIVEDETAEQLVKRIEALRAEDIAAHHQMPTAPPEPALLGYATATSNKNVVAVTVTDIDDYDEIEFTGKAARTPAAALALAAPFSVKVARSAIPINTDPLRAPHYVLAIPGVDNINVSRSTDGQTLYFLAQDDAAAFGIAVLGHQT